MASFVEAASLSSITQLAANPPKYPRNPTEQKRQPLVLYIARVPGCRDIILTTLKPRQKNVTSEDVASSLYYLHLDLASEVDGLESQEGNADVEIFPSRDSVIPRKPVRQESPVRNPIETECPPLLPARPGPEQMRGLLETRLSSKSQTYATTDTLPLQRTSLDRKPLPNVPVSQPDLPRRPLGPRPNLASSQLSRRPIPGEENIPFSSSLLQSDANRPMSRPSTYRTRSNLSLKADEVPTVETFSITVIRRDPVSGEQWNIGKIRGQQPGQESDQILVDRPKRDKPSLTYFVHLDTLGYGQFRGLQATSDTAAESGSFGVPESSAFINAGFNRTVRMEGSSFWERSFKRHQRGSSDQSDSRGNTRLRSNSDLLESGTSGVRDGDGASVDTSKLKGRGYVFSSPWNGHCEFSTGSGGKSLKCKHRLQEPASATRPISYSRESATVSELRFNLPSTTIFNNHSTSPNKVQSSASARPSTLHHIRNKLSASSRSETESVTAHTSYAAMYPHDDDDLGIYDRLDLSLGQEKAGGGTRGTRVKLGKLIVHDEGLKMLDLIVGANMGIWWGIWEK